MSTILLLHGVLQGGWIWQRVIPHLEAAGHRVLAPSLDGCGERHRSLRPGITTESQAAEIADLLFYQDLHDVVLVGTSSGGMVACRVAELARERIGRVVLADALALLDGERISDQVNRPNHIRTDIGSCPTREDAANRTFVTLDPETKDWAVDRITPHPIAVMDDPVKLDSFWDQSWNATVIWCRQSPAPPEPHHRRAAEKLGARWFELDTGHYPMLTEPKALAEMILAD